MENTKFKQLASGLFDVNYQEIKEGDIYINPNDAKAKTYTVYFKGGAFCGGSSIENAIPLAWETDIDDNEIHLDIDTSYIKIIGSVYDNN